MWSYGMGGGRIGRKYEWRQIRITGVDMATLENY